MSEATPSPTAAAPPAPPTAPTDARQWRRGRQVGELIELPGCGHVARLIRPSLTALAATTGGVPNPLSEKLIQLALGRRAANDEQALEYYRRNSRAYVEAAALCFVEPRLVLDREPGEGEIGPDDLTDLDYTWLYHSFIQGGEQEVAPFRIAREPETA
jgi:hypothetical protein